MFFFGLFNHTISDALVEEEAHIVGVFSISVVLELKVDDFILEHVLVHAKGCTVRLAHVE